VNHVALEFHHTGSGEGGIRLAAVTGDVSDFDIIEEWLRCVVRY